MPRLTRQDVAQAETPVLDMTPRCPNTHNGVPGARALCHDSIYMRINTKEPFMRICDVTRCLLCGFYYPESVKITDEAQKMGVNKDVVKRLITDNMQQTFDTVDVEAAIMASGRHGPTYQEEF